MQNSSGLFELFDKIRKIRGLTYQEIERISGIPKQTLFGLKRRDSINLKNLKSLAQVLNVSVDELLGLAPLTIDKQVPSSSEKFENSELIKIPVWKLSNYGLAAAAKYRFMSEEIGRKTFGIAVDSVETNFPKGTILYFNPDFLPQNDSIVLLQKDSKNYCIRKILYEGDDFYTTHLKLNISDRQGDCLILGVCVLIVTDLYFSSFD